MMYEILSAMSLQNAGFALIHESVIGLQLLLLYTELETTLSLETVLVLFLLMTAYIVI